MEFWVVSDNEILDGSCFYSSLAGAVQHLARVSSKSLFLSKVTIGKDSLVELLDGCENLSSLEIEILEQAKDDA